MTSSWATYVWGENREAATAALTSAIRDATAEVRRVNAEIFEKQPDPKK